MTKEERKEYDRLYRLNNIERLREREKTYDLNNKDKRKKYREESKSKRKEYYLKNKKEIIEKQKEYCLNNKEMLTKKRNKKLKSNPLFKLKCNIRGSIRTAIKRKGYTKKNKTIEILGCSFEEFKLHLELKFEDWMNWDNYGLYNGDINYGWDIDHVVPLDSAKTEEDVIRLNHYTNLQPLCSYINRYVKKTQKTTPPLSSRVLKNRTDNPCRLVVDLSVLSHYNTLLIHNLRLSENGDHHRSYSYFIVKPQ